MELGLTVAQSQTSEPVGESLWRDRPTFRRLVALAIVLSVATNLIQYFTPVVHSKVICDLALIFTDTCVVYVCVWAWRRSEGQNRKIVRLLALSNIFNLLGWFGTFAADNILHIYKPLGMPTDIFYSIGFGCLLAALIRLVTTSRRSEARLWTFLDGLVVALAFFGMSWQYVIRAEIVHQAGTELQRWSSMSFIAMDILVISVAYIALIRDRDSNSIPRSTIVYLGLAVLAAAIGDLILNWELVIGHSGADRRFTIPYVENHWLIAIACAAAVLKRSDKPSVVSVGVRSYGSIVAVFVVSLFTVPAIFISGRTPDNVLLGAAGLMFFFLMLRQILTLRENIALAHNLEKRVESRTAELNERTQEMQDRERRFRTLVQHSSDVVSVLDAEGNITYASPSIEQVFGLGVADWLDKAWVDVANKEDRKKISQALKTAMANPGKPVSAEWTVVGDEKTFRAESLITALIDEPTVGHIVVNTRDVSERHILENQLRYQASHDSLTGLANRTLFRAHLMSEIEEHRKGNSEFALLVCDLDGFKQVNDNYGHAAGDEILIQVSDRFRECVRGLDTIVGRLGGDEFGILVRHDKQTNLANEVATKIQQAVTRKFIAFDRDAHIGISIGIVTSTTEFSDLDDLMAKADMAMYTAKAEGKNLVLNFNSSMHESHDRQMKLEEELRHALGGDQLTLYYQPLVSLETGEIIGAEALLRWMHPVFGLVEPSEFIPLAEDSNLIVPIGRWVLEQAFNQANSLSLVGTSQPFQISINVSGRQLLHPDFIADLTELVQRSGVDTSRIILEVTETVLLRDLDRSTSVLLQLREMGFRLAMDDFGTGYSSLTYLRQFPFDILKIDRSFVGNLDSSAQDTELMEAILALGKVMKLETLAEGIETETERSVLFELGCQYGQGFLFHEPMPAHKLTSLLASPAEPWKPPTPVHK